MAIQLIFWSVLAVAMIIGLPVMLIWTVVDHFRGRGSDRRGSGSVSGGIGASMLELDRLVARPSVEYQVEAEQRVLKREDNSVGEK